MAGGAGRGAGRAANRRARRHRAAGKRRPQEGGRCALRACQPLRAAALCLPSGRAGVRGRALFRAAAPDPHPAPAMSPSYITQRACTGTGDTGFPAGREPTLLLPNFTSGPNSPPERQGKASEDSVGSSPPTGR